MDLNGLMLHLLIVFNHHSISTGIGCHFVSHRLAITSISEIVQHPFIH